MRIGDSPTSLARTRGIGDFIGRGRVLTVMMAKIRHTHPIHCKSVWRSTKACANETHVGVRPDLLRYPLGHHLLSLNGGSYAHTVFGSTTSERNASWAAATFPRYRNTMDPNVSPTPLQQVVSLLLAACYTPEYVFFSYERTSPRKRLRLSPTVAPVAPEE